MMILTKEQINSLVAFLYNKKVPRICDGTLKNTRIWMRSNLYGDLHEAVIAELISKGISCDCDILLSAYQNYIEYAADYQNPDGSFGREIFGINIPGCDFYKQDIIYRYFIDKFEKPDYKLLNISLSGSPAKSPEKLLEQYEKDKKDKLNLTTYRAKTQHGQGEIEDKALLESIIREELRKQNAVAMTLNSLLAEKPIASEYLFLGEECLSTTLQSRGILTYSIDKIGTYNSNNCCLDTIFQKCFELANLPYIIRNQIKIMMRSDIYQSIRKANFESIGNSIEQLQAISNLKDLIQQYNLTEKFCREQIKKSKKATSNKSGKLITDIITQFYLKTISEVIHTALTNNDKFYTSKFIDLISIVAKNNKTGIQFNGNSILFDNNEFKVLLPENEFQLQELIGKTKYCRLKREWINGGWEYSVDLIIENKRARVKSRTFSESTSMENVASTTVVTVPSAM